MNRAYSLIQVKEVSDKRRVFTGMATTPETDRMGDTVNPLGATFRNPVTLLHQHKHDMPIGKVKLLKPTARGIEFEAEIPIVEEEGELKERLDMAWAEIKHGLVNAVSIGFSPLKYAYTDSGIDFQEIEIYELSTVSIPANAGARISVVKSMDKQLRREAGVAEPDEVSIPKIKSKDPLSHAATGTQRSVVVRLDAPGASGKTKTVSPSPKEAHIVKTVADRIAEFEETLRGKSARMNDIMTKSAEEGVTLDAAQEEEYDGLSAEVKSLKTHITRLKDLEATNISTAKAVDKVNDVRGGSDVRGGTSVQVKAEPKLPPGIGFARLAKVKAISRLDGSRPVDVATQLYGENSIVVGAVKAAVVAGSNVSGNWAYDLVSQEGGIVADFAAFLRPATLIGRFGTGNVPALRQLPFRTPVVIQTGGGAGYWVGEGKPKPLTAFDFDRTTLDPLKVANIAVLTEESLRDSSPSSEMIVRDSLRDALAARLDTDFINPAKTASAGVSPASITNGAGTIAATGTDADAVRLQVRALMAKFIAANNAVSDAVWIMSSNTALSLSLLVNALGQDEFPGVNMMGGVFMGLPVLVSDYVSGIVVLVKASDIYLGDEGGVSVDMSREASLEMLDGSLTQDALAGTGASLVSMFQTNSVALRGERTINWKRRRPSAVAYLTGVNWGGGVPNS